MFESLNPFGLRLNMTVKKFEELESWQQARMLCKEVYQVTQTQEFERDIRFCSQIRAAVGSIMDNIAEGFEREGKKEFVQFLYIAKGSCGEVRSQLYRAFDVGYITENQFLNLKQQTLDLGNKITNFVRYLNRTDIQGLKYKA